MRGPGFAYLALIVFLLIGVAVKSNQDAATLRASQISGCERGKRDRADHASVYWAMATYYDGVTKAESVKADVKVIAGWVRDQLERSAVSVTSRILLCEPLIDDGKQIPDRALIDQLPDR